MKKNYYYYINSIRNIFIISLMTFIVGIGALQIFLRYVPGLNPFSWVDEIMRYLNIWLIFLAASVGIRESCHLCLEYFLHKIFKDKAFVVVQRIIQVLVVVSLCLVIYFGALRVLDNRNTIIQSLPIPISIFYAAIPIGGAMILFDYLLIAIYECHPYASKIGTCEGED